MELNKALPQDAYTKYTELGVPSPFPSDDVPASVKESREWCMQIAVAIWGQYCLNNTGLPYSLGTNQYDYTTLRLYAEGNQPIEKYKQILTHKNPDKNNTKRGTYNAISWDNHSVLPRFESVILEKLHDYETTYSPVGTDENSINAKTRMKNYIWEKSQNPLYQLIYKQLGIKETEQLPFVPADKNELEMWSSMKLELAHELNMAKAVKYVFEQSEWPDELKQQIYRDLFRLGISVTYEYVQPHTNMPKISYCDPSFAIFMKSNQYGYLDIPFGGDVIFMTIAEVRKQLKSKGQFKTEQDLIDRLKMYINYNSNSVYGNTGWNVGNSPANNNWTTTDPHGTMPYDYLKVPILRCEMKTWNTDVYSEIKTKSGETVTRKEDYNYNKNDEKRKTVKKGYEMWYKCWWVIGTEICIDWGAKEYIKRDANGKTYSGYTIIRTDSRSMVARMIPDIDEIELITKRFMMAWKNASPSGYAVFMNVLKNVTYKDQKLHPFDLIQIQRDTGTMIIDDGALKNVQGKAQTPIIPLAGGVGPILNEFIASYQFYRQRLSDITGISDAMLGANPIPGQLKSTTEIALAGSENVIKPLGRAYNLMKKRVYQKVICDIQTIAKFNPEGFRAAFVDLSDNTLQKILIVAGDADFNYTLRAEPEATEMMKQEILVSAKEASAKGQISYPDYLQMVKYVSEGNVRFATALLEYKLMKRQEVEQQINMQNIQANGEQQQKSLEAKGQIDAQLIQMKGQIEALQQQLKNQGAIQTTQMNNQTDILLLDKQLKFDAEHPAPAANK